MPATPSDGSEARDAGRPAVSLHPAFPAIVAAWFAALLGAGSLVLPAALLERAVEASGVAALVPAAAPPLGFTARGLIALAAAGAGALAGMAIARRVAHAHRGPPLPGSAQFPGGARRPLSVSEELGGDSLVTGFGLPLSRRRAHGFAEDEPSDGLPHMAPLPARDLDKGARGLERDRPAPPRAAEDPSEKPLPFTAPSLSRRVRSASVDDPALPELVERLGASIEHRRAARAGAAAPPAVPPPQSGGFDPADPDDAARAMAAYFGRPQPAGSPAMPGPAGQRRHAGYPPHGRGFPGDRAETDAALRAALATLQRMSGAA